MFHPQPAAQELLSRMREKAGRHSGIMPIERRTVSSGWSLILPAAAPARIEDLAFATVSELASLFERARSLPSISQRCISPASSATIPRCTSSSRSPKTAPSRRRKKPTRRLPRASIAARCTASRGAPKDLLAVKGYPTTWGAGGFEHQVIDEDATVVQRLDEAGAVLVAKFTLGALAMGDHWFGGQTRNPWNPSQGSSGSSAGPASAVAAGCVGFAIGSETLGSISSPSTRCGDSGLRPTFGFVPRTGAMALSWTMDKLGPICRSAEDCALVLEAICGPDGKDTSVYPFASFHYDPSFDWKTLRIGYLKSAFEPPKPEPPAAPPPNETADEKQKREARAAGRARQPRL